MVITPTATETFGNFWMKNERNLPAKDTDSYDKTENVEKQNLRKCFKKILTVLILIFEWILPFLQKQYLKQEVLDTNSILRPTKITKYLETKRNTSGLIQNQTAGIWKKNWINN